MAFTVEDGSGIDGANSYATVEYAVSYFAERGRTAEFDGTPDQQKGWLVQATDYIERYRERFKSAPYFATQSLSFPRAAPDGSSAAWFPDVLVKAACEYAARAKLGPLVRDQPAEPRTVLVGKTIGPIDKRYQVVDRGAPTGRFQAYPAADALLVGLLRDLNQRVIR